MAQLLSFHSFQAMSRSGELGEESGLLALSLEAGVLRRNMLKGALNPHVVISM